MLESPAELMARLGPLLADRYAMIRELGQGGMATVFLADDLRHFRTVAIKVLNPDMTEGVGADRFLREIQTSARLNHPHILPLLDSGRAGDLLFYVMPAVEGETLRDRLDREGRLTVEDAIRFTSEIADGLAYAHRAGIVHRDIKPENVLLSSGHAVITDFGISRALDEAGNMRLTRTGAVTGTPSYMSPEQWDAAPDLDGRADQYALGCVAYEMLTGEQPYIAPTAMQVMMRHLQAPVPSPREVRPEIPEFLDAAIRTTLGKTPDQRFPTTDGLVQALRSATVVTLPAVPAAPAAVRRKPRYIMPAVGVALLTAIIGYGVFVIAAGDGSAERTRIVVLPFVNQGASGDLYFADGISEEITNRLAGIASLSVIARTSAVQYRSSPKTSRDIGTELGVDYLVEGSVRWERASSGGDAVRITARLISVANGEVLWPYDTTATVKDVFTIQSGIARKVAENLNVLLVEPEERRLARQPTTNLEAYDQYLRGNAAYDRSWAKQDVETALAHYQRATELDPDFALAWAKLARTHAWMHQLRLDLSEDRLVSAKTAADRAVALDPDLPEAQVALGLYWYWGMAEYERALQAFTRAGELQSSNAEVFLQIGNVRRRQGRFVEAIDSYRRSAELNPRYHRAWFNLGETLLFVREYDEAAEHLQRARDLSPDFLEAYVQQARVAINSSGNIDEARAILRAAEERIPPTAWRATMLDFARIIYNPNLGEYLDRMRPGAYGLDSGTYHVVRGRLLQQLDSRAAAKAQFDSARVRLEQMRQEQPGEAWIHGLLAVTYAGVDMPDEAVRAGRRAMSLLPVADDALDGPEWVINLANVFVRLGQMDSARVYFDQALAIPSWTSLNALRADPLLDGFEATPQFRQLAQKWARARSYAEERASTNVEPR